VKLAGFVKTFGLDIETKMFFPHHFNKVIDFIEFPAKIIEMFRMRTTESHWMDCRPRNAMARAR